LSGLVLSELLQKRQDLSRGLSMKATTDRRTTVRMLHKFPVRLVSARESLTLPGVTMNVSQEGALVWTNGWRSFQVNDETLITIFLPGSFTGHDAPRGLRGRATVTRIDETNEGVALRFNKRLRQFDPVDRSEVPNDL
jgi:hypothetical protein